MAGKESKILRAILSKRENLERERMIEQSISGDPLTKFEDDDTLSPHNKNLLMGLIKEKGIDEIIEHALHKAAAGGFASASEFHAELTSGLGKVLEGKYLEEYGRDKTLQSAIAVSDVVVSQKFKKDIERSLSTNGIIIAGGNNVAYMDQHALDNFKNYIKRVIVYEAHKKIDPHCLAGETKVQNFVNNMIVGGLKYAEKHEGAREAKMVLSKERIKDLEREHQNISWGMFFATKK